MDAVSTTKARLGDQIRWYDRESRRAQRLYKLFKLLQITSAALLPLVAVFEIPEPEKIAAVLGLVVLVLEGAQQLNQYQQNWVSYRSTCEALKHEKHLFDASAGPYTDAENPHTLFAERVESLISREHASWVSVQEQAKKKGERQEV